MAEHAKKDGADGVDEQSGSALIVAIAILFVMIVLGVALLNISSSERKSSRAYSDQVQARMLAFSGIEHVRSNLSELGRPASVYHGEDWDNDRNDTDLSSASVSTVNGGPAANNESENGNRTGGLDTLNVDPKYALHPSFATTDSSTGQPKLIEMKEENRTVYRGYTGALPASYGGLGTNTYSVRAAPEQGININSLNPHLGTMIDHLCDATPGCSGTPGTTITGPFREVVVEEKDPDADGTPEQRVVKTPAGDRPSLTLNLETYRMKGGYGSVQELETVLTTAQYNALSGFFVVNSSVRVNRSTIRPKPQNTDLTFDERGDCGSELEPYPTQNNCRDDDDDGQSQDSPGSTPAWSSELLDPYPLPDRVPGEAKAIRGPSFENTSAQHPEALMTHTEQVKWVNNAGGADPRAFPASLSKDQTNQPYGAFRYNFDYRIQPRVPVQINSASTTVMKSLIEGIEARVIETTQKNVTEPNGDAQPYIETRWFNPMYQTRVLPQPGGEYTSTGTRNGHGISASLAVEIARKIEAYRNQDISIEFRGTSSDPSKSYQGPFRTWPEFEAFIDQWVVDVDNGNWNGSIPKPVSNDVGYLLKAHFNPNTHFGKFNWNTNGQWTWVSDGKDSACSGSRCPWQGNRATIDKTDFLYHTTEFTFLPPTHYRIQSYGRVTGPEGRIKAESSLEGIYKFGFARHTTQADFVVNEKAPVNTVTYPENVLNVGLDNILNRENNGSGLGGQLSIKTKTDQNPIQETNTAHWFEWSFDLPDESTRGKYGVESGTTDPVEFTVQNRDHPTQDKPPTGDDTEFNGLYPGDENDPHMPMSWFTREFNDVSDDATEKNFGLLGGRWRSGEHEDYPWDESDFNPPDNSDPPLDLQPSSDPYNYSDVTPDGALITSDRYRSIRFLTTQRDIYGDQVTAPDIIPRRNQQGESENSQWGHGHVEFWWKPRAMTTTPSSGNAPAGDSKIIYPLWRHWILGRSQRLAPMWYWTPHHVTDTNGDGKDNKYYDPSWHTKTMVGDRNNPWYAYQQSHDPSGGGRPLNPTKATGNGAAFRWAGGNRHAGNKTSSSPGGVVRAPVDETQPWAGYDCSYLSDYARQPVAGDQKFDNGQGLNARISPETGCLTAYPGIQFLTVQRYITVPSMAALTQSGGGNRSDYFRDLTVGNQSWDQRTWGDMESPDAWKNFEALPSRTKSVQDGKPRFDRHRGRGWRSQNLKDRQLISYHKFFEHAGISTSPTKNSYKNQSSHTWPNLKLGDSLGYFFRAYYVKQPAGNGPSQWVFKISQEGFLDMDVGLREKNDKRMSPPATTDWRDVWSYDVQVEEDVYGGNSKWDSTAMELTGELLPDICWGCSPPEYGWGPAGNLENRWGRAHLPPGDAVATLNADGPRTTPKPGKWNHIVLEWDFRGIYDFYRNTSDCLDGVGCGDTYPIFVPWDVYPTTIDYCSVFCCGGGSCGDGGGYTDGPLQVTNSGLSTTDDISNASATDPNWLPLVTIPIGDNTNTMWHITKKDPSRRDDNASAVDTDTNSKWVVPHITVNGVHKDNTDLFMGNINPETGKFQPPFLMFAEHIVFAEDDNGTNPVNENPLSNKNENYPEVDDELWTGFQYLRHWTYKHFGQLGQFGSNLRRRTKRYGQYTANGNRNVRYNWARFYDDGFINGTVDELYGVNLHNRDGSGNYSFDAFYQGRYKDPSTVDYVGRFHRGSNHDHGGQTYWDTSGDGERDLYNNYAEVDQRILVGDKSDTIQIKRIGHTQYLPADDHTGTDYLASGVRATGDNLSELNRPYFKLQFKSQSAANWRTRTYSPSGSRAPASPNGRWLGEPISPKKLSGSELTLPPGDDLLYRITVENGNPTTNITPFLEDLSILYSGTSSTGLRGISFYSP